MGGGGEERRGEEEEVSTKSYNLQQALGKKHTASDFLCCFGVSNTVIGIPKQHVHMSSISNETYFSRSNYELNVFTYTYIIYIYKQSCT